jgi:hypothetical protein
MGMGNLFRGSEPRDIKLGRSWHLAGGQAVLVLLSHFSSIWAQGLYYGVGLFFTFAHTQRWLLIATAIGREVFPVANSMPT